MALTAILDDPDSRAAIRTTVAAISPVTCVTTSAVVVTGSRLGEGLVQSACYQVGGRHCRVDQVRRWSPRWGFLPAVVIRYT